MVELNRIEQQHIFSAWIITNSGFVMESFIRYSTEETTLFENSLHYIKLDYNRHIHNERHYNYKCYIMSTDDALTSDLKSFYTVNNNRSIYLLYVFKHVEDSNNIYYSIKCNLVDLMKHTMVRFYNKHKNRSHRDK